jgi:hypothetical protein
MDRNFITELLTNGAAVWEDPHTDELENNNEINEIKKNEENDEDTESNESIPGLESEEDDEEFIITLKQEKLIENMVDMDIIFNDNCHSSGVLSHDTFFRNVDYNIKRTSGKSKRFPILRQGGNFYSGIEFTRKLFENKGITDVEEKSLQVITDGNEHRNCNPLYCSKTENQMDGCVIQ